ncbi:cation diffusion facilitator family transporter [Paraglaciecola aquimarina]|uniref:Cation diffusion facilitator family transporter n=1 Tax=Paraglaciecola algarum TaxID=3050085 RepID=A0ABS9D4F5_9ALTE|nr:cation diffusion facilitator family transporter [Paraglaciecola sp. G1-23]MCF2946913.1 cation diffusion facilitator family transporter [Paraglaciecola sp. G1-23]
MKQNKSLSQDTKAQLMRWATYASFSVALILISSKIWAWLLSDSVSLLATLVDSSLDLVASLINLLAVRHALSPADKEHRFGHGKAEALAGMAQAMFIAGSAVFLLLESSRRMLNPVAVEEVGVGMAVMVWSIILTSFLIVFQRYVYSQTGSTAIKADSLHYQTDILVNGTVLLALWLASTGWSGFDPLFAILIAIYILYSVWEIVTESYDHLMDKEMSNSDRQRITAVVNAHPDTKGIHDLRTRSSGTTIFIQFHLELADDLTLINVHKISDQIEKSLLAIFPSSEIIIHEDPISVAIREQQPEFDELAPSSKNRKSP